MTNLPTLGRLPPLPSNIDIDGLVQDILRRLDPTAEHDLFAKAYWLGAVARAAGRAPRPLASYGPWRRRHHT